MSDANTPELKEFENSGSLANAKSISVKGRKFRDNFQLDIEVVENATWSWVGKETLEHLCELQFDFVVESWQLHEWLYAAISEGTLSFEESAGEAYINFNVEEDNQEYTFRIPAEGSLTHQTTASQAIVKESAASVGMNAQNASPGKEIKELKDKLGIQEKELGNLRLKVGDLESRLQKLEETGGSQTPQSASKTPQSKGTPQSRGRKQSSEEEEEEKDLTVGQAKVVASKTGTGRFSKKPRRL